MQITTPNSPDLSTTQQAIFAQGAAEILGDGENSAALWHQHTPCYQGQPIGTIGACNLEDSASAASFIAACAERLHTQHGCDTIVGPMNANTWLKHRLIISSSGRAPFLMEPIEPDFYHRLFEQAGFSILSQYSSSQIDLRPEQPTFNKYQQRIDNQGITIRHISSEHFEHDLESIHALCLISFAQNFLYTPLPKTAFTQKYLQSRDLIDADMVLLAERQREGEAELVGFVFCTPDHLARKYNQQPAIIVKTLACLPDRQLAGLGTLLVSQVHNIAKSKGYTEAIHALQYEANSSQRISQRFNATRFRTYALMAKQMAKQFTS